MSDRPENIYNQNGAQSDVLDTNCPRLVISSEHTIEAVYNLLEDADKQTSHCIVIAVIQWSVI